VLLLHGADDTTVSSAHTTKFAARLRAIGVPVTVHNYDGANHVSLVGALATPVRFLHPVHEDIAGFLADLRSVRTCR
jgi:acetyl esterase/lipase